jgi:xanthine dehydrogenase accessory factor
VVIVQELAAAVRQVVQEVREAVVGRVVDVKGFSTMPGDGLVVLEPAGDQHGELLGRPGAAQLRTVAAGMFGEDAAPLQTVTVAIQGKDVTEVGLSCGGQATVVMQPVASIPGHLWELLATRAPAALVTRIEGAAAGPSSLVVDGEGHTWGALDADADAEVLVREAVAVLGAGRSASRRIEDEAGVVLVEGWVPAPRLVVVGSGDLVAALVAQSALLDWDCRGTESPGEIDGLIDWAGGSAALIVLSHNPHVDTPALAAALARRVPYVGALGSRATQSRRIDRLTAVGVSAADIDQIHRPIGLDLGGRRAPEIALAIVAEILACHCGRDARPLRYATGPINDRPTTRPAG